MDTVEETATPRRVAIVLASVWAMSIVATILTHSLWITLASLFLGGTLPFAFVVLWLASSRFGQLIREAASVWHLRILSASALFAYSVYAHKWASDLINELFLVDARYFGVSTAVIAVLFAPFGLIYRQEVVGWLWVGFLFVGAALTYILPLSLLPPRRAAFGWRAWVKAGLFVLIGSFILAMSGHLARSFRPAAMTFAVWADFNAKHPCTDAWASHAEGVVFLGDQRVLVYSPSSPIGGRFTVESCNFSRRF